jgi:hypothetical protein
LLEILDAAPIDYPFFFQLYINKDRSMTEELLRVVNSRPQIKAIFVTVDLPVVSKREADERIKLDALTSSGLGGRSASSDNKGSGLARSVGSFIDPAFSWDDLAWLRRHTKLPIVLKGIQSAADARIAMQMGCQGVLISNHGGRALDGAPATILVLLELHRECPEVFDYMEVFIDGGFRRGSDILKALCLGASGVGMGRPFMYAISYGTEGVKHLVNSKWTLLLARLTNSADSSLLHSLERRGGDSYATCRPPDPRRSRPGLCQHCRAGRTGAPGISPSVCSTTRRTSPTVSLVIDRAVTKPSWIPSVKSTLARQHMLPIGQIVVSVASPFSGRCLPHFCSRLSRRSQPTLLSDIVQLPTLPACRS